MALTLLGIFLFPVIFQSVHTAGHKKACCSGHEHSCAVSQPERTTPRDSPGISQNEEPCPICNYQFPVNKLPDLSVFASHVPVVTAIVSDIIPDVEYRPVFSTKSPRAPPV